MLKALAGIHPFDGDILVDGTSVSKQPIAYRKKVGFADADPIFPEYLSLDDLIRVVSKAKRTDTDEIDLLKSCLNVEGFTTQALGTYSSGMLKKSAILLAFIGNPKLIILDEPYSTLDLNTQHSLNNLISKKINIGSSFLLTSHQSEPISAFDIQGIIELDMGRIVRNETP